MQEIVKRLINLRWLHISVSSNSYCCFPSDVVVAVEVVSVLLEDWTDLLLWTVTMVRVCWWSRTPSVEEVLSEVTTLLWIDWLLWTAPLISVRWPTRMVLLLSSPPSFVLWMLSMLALRKKMPKQNISKDHRQPATREYSRSVTR